MSFWWRKHIVFSTKLEEGGSPVLTLVAAYNHIGWTCSFPPAYLLYLGKGKNRSASLLQSLDTVGTKIQYPAFFWILDVWFDHTSTSITYYQLFRIMGAFPCRCGISLLQNVVLVSAAVGAVRAGCHYLFGWIIKKAWLMHKRMGVIKMLNWFIEWFISLRLIK